MLKKYIFSLLLMVAICLGGMAIKTEAANYEYAWFPAPSMNITQIAYESFSHDNHNAIDFSPGGNVFAPFTGKIVYKDARWGYVLLQSTNKVYYADGTLDYMTVALMHDSDISNLSVGQVINQGTAFYQAGGMDNGNPDACDAHVDLSVFKGQVSSVTQYGRGNVYAYDAFYINKNKTTSIINKGKLKNGNTITNGGYSDWSGLWKELSTKITTKPTISSDKAVYKTGSDVVLRRNTVANTNFYQLIVWYKEKQILSTKMPNTTYTLNDLKAGRYEVYLQVGNSASGTITSSCYVFDVQTPITTKPTISSDKTVYKTGSDVVLKRNTVANTNFYQLIVWYKEEQILSTKMPNTTYSLNDLKAGRYEVYLQVGNAVSGTITSSCYIFDVQTPITVKPTITSDKTVYKEGNNVVLKRNTVTNTNFYQLIVWYKDKQILSTKMPNTTYTLSDLDTGDYRVYLQVGNSISGTITSVPFDFYVEGKCSHDYITSIDKASFGEDGVQTNECTNCEKTSENLISAVETPKLSYTNTTYSGSKKTPEVIVKDKTGKLLENGKDYTLSYSSSKRTSVGRYYVTIKLKGKYTGSKNVYFTITPKAPSSASASLYSSYNKVKISWKKCTGASGYAVYYKKAQEPESEYKRITRTTKLSCTKSSLTSGINYEFKVVPYYKKKISGKTTYFESEKYIEKTVYTLKKLRKPTVEPEGTKVRVQWENISGESGYQISKSTSSKKTSIISTYSTTIGDSKIISATKGKTYYYKVRAYKTVSGKRIYGPWSDVVSYKR